MDARHFRPSNRAAIRRDLVDVVSRLEPQDRLKVEYQGPNHDRVEATPAKDVRYLKPPQRPGAIDGPGGKVKVLKSKKNPLDEWEIEGRAMAALMLPPGQSVSGFFYFQTRLQHTATIYLSGLYEAGTGKEIF